MRAHEETGVAGPSALGAAFSPRERTLPSLLERQSERYGNRPLLIAGDVTWTYVQTRDMAARFASTLSAAGVQAADRVAVMCSNRAEFMQTFLGCAWLGAIAVPINTASRGSQLQHVLGNSGARLLIIEAEFAEAMDQVDRRALAVEKIWVVGESQEPLSTRYQWVSWPEPAGSAPRAQIRPGQTVAILYTSGTTGLSKGVCCPHAQFFWWGVNSSCQLGVREGDVLLTCLPLFHTNALNSFFQALLNGATLVVEKRFSASGLWKALIRHRATVTYLLGAMVPILMSKVPTPEERAHTVRVALAPGVPVHFHADFFQRTGIRIIDGYGSTETNHVIGGDASVQRSGYMGKVYNGFEARVVDDDDNEVPAGQPGELILRAHEPFAFATGYFAMDDKTVEAWRNLWFHTGDRVIQDEHGYFKFVDRLKDAIRRRGENISSFEVEQVLSSHPSIETVAVYPVPAEMAEDEVMAAVVLRQGASATEIALMQFCEPRLPYFAVPRFLEFFDELPVTENGKIQKYKLRERGITDRTWDREAAGYRLRRLP
ncbi:MAG: ATP-dependent acyl-CoA ligase [Xanthobacteraceae bacterium]